MEKNKISIRKIKREALIIFLAANSGAIFNPHLKSKPSALKLHPVTSGSLSRTLTGNEEKPKSRNGHEIRADPSLSECDSSDGVDSRCNTLLQRRQGPGSGRGGARCWERLHQGILLFFCLFCEKMKKALEKNNHATVCLRNFFHQPIKAIPVQHVKRISVWRMRKTWRSEEILIMNAYFLLLLFYLNRFEH